MADDRSPEELAGGFLRCSVGGATRNMPTLKLRAENEWRMLLAEKLSQTTVEVDLSTLAAGGEAAYGAIAPLANLPSQVMLDLVLAYDKSGSLGGRDFLEENADSGQLWAVLQRIFRVVFPFVSSLRELLTQLRELGGMVAVARGPSASLNSRNGASDTGPALTSGASSTADSS